MSNSPTVQLGSLTLRRRPEGWQYLRSGGGNEPEVWRDAAHKLAELGGAGVPPLLIELAGMIDQNETLATGIDLIKAAEFERGKMAEQDRLAVELFDRGGFATLQLNQLQDGVPRMRFVSPSNTHPVRAVRLRDGVILVKANGGE